MMSFLIDIYTVYVCSCNNYYIFDLDLLTKKMVKGRLKPPFYKLFIVTI